MSLHEHHNDMYTATVASNQPEPVENKVSDFNILTANGVHVLDTNAKPTNVADANASHEALAAEIEQVLARVKDLKGKTADTLPPSANMSKEDLIAIKNNADKELNVVEAEKLQKDLSGGILGVAAVGALTGLFSSPDTNAQQDPNTLQNAKSDKFAGLIPEGTLWKLGGGEHFGGEHLGTLAYSENLPKIAENFVSENVGRTGKSVA